ncbi:hypothetical protein N1F78_15425 [Seonamhaeicola sp. MEBiC1930]|uniref:hypothetical protein n=1 Tax=Seonamhaeicola sp. MEBiC01930 TaxID=2976768 RepID=UPI003243A162
MAKKTWTEKRDTKKEFILKTIDKKFADIPGGSKMPITTPLIIDDYVKCIPFGKTGDMSTMRNDLAIEYGADKTCPVTSGIFLRIASEAAYEEIITGKSIMEVTPFWLIVEPSSKLAKKLQCGVEFIEAQRQNEGI